MSNKLQSKIFISGQILAKTGLHIGGSKTALNIGDIDLNVIKTADGKPFIPGSSLKGKLRSMLAKLEGSIAVSMVQLDSDQKILRNQDRFKVKIDDDVAYLREIFGSTEHNTVTRLVVRDAFLDKEAFDNEFEGLELENDYTETKWENTIDRKNGTAKNPRQLERVPAGTIFNFEMVYDEYNDSKTNDHLGKIRLAMRLLQDDYLGGSGSRGYGQIKFQNVITKKITVEGYAKDQITKENVVFDFAI